MGRLENENLYVPVGEKRGVARLFDKYDLPSGRSILKTVALALAVLLVVWLILLIFGLRLTKVKYDDGKSYSYFGFMSGDTPTAGKWNASDGSSAKVGGGKVNYSDGSTYSGDLKGFLKDGQGTFTQADGSVYVGGFKEDLFEGNGKITFADGSTYEGGFSGGLYEGQGEIRAADGKLVYSGSFEKGEKHGTGTLYYENGDSFSGTFENGMRKSGVYRWKSGESIDGEFVNNRPDETKKVIYRDSSGTTYKAYYKNGELSEKQRYYRD